MPDWRNAREARVDMAMSKRSGTGESADSVAEIEGFEPAVPFHLCFARIVRKLARFSRSISDRQLSR